MARRFQFKLSTLLAAAGLVGAAIIIHIESRSPPGWRSDASILVAMAVFFMLACWATGAAKR